MSGMDKSQFSSGESTSLPGVNTANTSTISESRKIVYRSEVMRQLMRMVDRVAPSNATVLILGESGTGKELIAHADARALQPAEQALCRNQLRRSS